MSKMIIEGVKTHAVEGVLVLVASCEGTPMVILIPYEGLVRFPEVVATVASHAISRHKYELFTDYQGRKTLACFVHSGSDLEFAVKIQEPDGQGRLAYFSDAKDGIRVFFQAKYDIERQRFALALEYRA